MNDPEINSLEKEQRATLRRLMKQNNAMRLAQKLRNESKQSIVSVCGDSQLYANAALMIESLVREIVRLTEKK
jgi:Mg/Co/Ni transporter MgtE